MLTSYFPLMFRRFFNRFSTKIPADRAGRGAFGERHAARYLKKRGLRVLACNWTHGHDELDLVCREGDILVFVEVRTRDHTALVSGYHSVTAVKKQKLRRAAKAYLYQLRQPPAHTRFDIVEVTLGPGDAVDITHHPGVTLLG